MDRCHLIHQTHGERHREGRVWERNLWSNATWFIKLYASSPLDSTSRHVEIFPLYFTSKLSGIQTWDILNLVVHATKSHSYMLKYCGKVWLASPPSLWITYKTCQRECKYNKPCFRIGKCSIMFNPSETPQINHVTNIKLLRQAEKVFSRYLKLLEGFAMFWNEEASSGIAPCYRKEIKQLVTS